MFSPTDCFCQNPEVVYRDVDEWKSGLAFEPDRPCLYMLNPTAMLMWELCRDGRRLDAIEQQYCELLGNRLGPEAARSTAPRIDGHDRFGTRHPNRGSRRSNVRSGRRPAPSIAFRYPYPFRPRRTRPARASSSTRPADTFRRSGPDD